MEKVIREEIITARKSYRCDASERWLESGYSVDDCETADQKLFVEAAEADKWRILRGQAYMKITGIQDGDICVYRARPGMDTVCFELDMWDS